MTSPVRLKLFTHPVSIFPLRVKIALHEKGVPFDEVQTELGADAKPHFAERNPFRQVPVLDDDGFVVAESMAILEYLDDKWPQPSLVAGDVEARATMRKLMCWSTDYLVAPWKLWLAPRLGDGVLPWTPESVEQGRLGICTHLDVMQQQLGDREWLVGDYSLADICYAPFLLALDPVGLGEEVDARPQVRAWLNRLRARDAVVAALRPSLPA